MNDFSKTAWPDRRPIGSAFLSDPSYRSADNKPGWNPQLIDVKDVEGSWKKSVRETFIPLAKKYGCQLVKFHDIEGSEDPHPITYRGSPVYGLSDITTGMVKWAVDEFGKEKLGVGFTLRPTWYAGGNAQQLPPLKSPADVVAWQVRLCDWYYGPNVKAFYLDSWVDFLKAWSDGKPHPLGAAGLPPGRLYMPEYGTEAYGMGWGHPDALKVGNFAPWRNAKYAADPVTLAANARYGSFETILPPYNWQPTPDQKDRVIAELRAGHVIEIAVHWEGHPDTPWILECVKAAQGK